jgi:hypothetical protein
MSGTAGSVETVVPPVGSASPGFGDPMIKACHESALKHHYHFSKLSSERRVECGARRSICSHSAAHESSIRSVGKCEVSDDGRGKPAGSFRPYPW